MVICGLADIHGEMALIGKALDSAGHVDVALLLGDITNFGHAEEARTILAAVREKASCVLAVAGNCDYRDVEDFLEAEGVAVHRKGIVLNGIGFVGAGKSLPCVGKTPNEACENDFRRFLQEGISCLPPDVPMVFVLHEPPANTNLDLARARGHVGSTAIRDFVEKEQPLICFSGHIHEAQGIDAIGLTRLLNPGPLRDGKYAFAELDGTFVKRLEIRNV